jgi:hypothetical protein
MYPRSRRAALLSTLEAEAAMRSLTLAAFDHWRPAAEAALLPTLTASAPTLPPNPAALAETDAVWAQLTDELILYGSGLIFARELTEAYLALGGDLDDIPAELLDPAETEPEPSALNEQSVDIVAGVLGVSAATVWRTEKLSRSPLFAAPVTEYRAGARPAVFGQLAGVTAEAATVVDKATLANVPTAEVRLEVNLLVGPTSPTLLARAEQLARTQSAGSQSSATILAAQLRTTTTGREMEQAWFCTLDGKTRRTHWAADGQRVPLGSKFKLGRHEIAYPGDPRGPVAETANCRCRVAVLAADDELPVENDRHTERGPGNSTVKNRRGSQADEIARRADEGNIRAREDPDGLGRVASAQPTEENSMDTETVETITADGAEETGAETYRTFTDAKVAVLGSPTDDGRILAAGMDLRFRDFPLPVMWVKQTGEGHANAYTVGVIEDARVDGTDVLASGYLLNTAEADEAAGQLAHGVSGPSVDLADAEWDLTNEDGSPITESQWEDPELKVYTTFSSAKLLGFTLVSTPAFGETKLELDPERSERTPASVEASGALVAAGARYVEAKHPAEFFTDPKLTGPTLPTISEDGRVFGHLACFDACHVGYPNECKVAPRSFSNYAHFLTAPPVLTEDGTRVKVGRLTVGTGHAGGRMAARPAAEHYDNTGTCFALVAVGEDEFGIWFSGVPAPGATDEQIAVGLSAPLSGDWRKLGGNLELVAALAVNTPGFPILASGAIDEDGSRYSLVASLGPRADESTTAAAPLTADQLREFGAAVVTEMRAAERRDAEARAILASAAEKDEQARRAAALALIEKVGS